MKSYRIPLFLILSLGFLVKLPALGQPLTGHFGSYQAMVAMMGEMMVKGLPGSLLVPRTFLIIDGLPAYHLLYYPFGALAAVVMRSLFGGELDLWGRFQAAVFVFGAGWAMFHIARKFVEERTALLAAFLFTFSPMVLVSGISFQNEAVALFFLTFSFWLLTSRSWIRHRCLTCARPNTLFPSSVCRYA